MVKRLECRNYAYAIVRKNKTGDPDECIVYMSTDILEAKSHQEKYYQNYDWSNVVYEIWEIWGNHMCPVLEFDTNDITVMLEQKIKKYDQQARNKPECLIYDDPETQCICLRDPDPDGDFDCKECCWNNKNKKHG